MRINYVGKLIVKYFKIWKYILSTPLLFLSTSADANVSRELIVLAAPTTGESYYADTADSIFNFHVNYANQIIKNNDDVLILVDAGAYDRYVKALGDNSVAIYPMGDIWARDYSLSNTENPIMFRYTSAAQGHGKEGQSEADYIQEKFAELSESAGLKFIESDLLNDGGNFVDDYAGNAVVSRKFLRDNRLTEEKAREVLTKLAGLKNIAFIDSDEQGGLEHSDGVVSFVDTNTLIINSYSEDPVYAEKLKSDLRRGLPNVIIHEIVTPYDDSEIYDDRFGSACGLYTNALVTPNRIYLPQFGIPEDKKALEQVQKATTRQVVPIASANVCHMGGGVRCTAWQLRNQNALALLKYFGKATLKK
ncbi:agmatine deiminase family protein [Vibrio europaeus]|uniref:Agmatine deiminase family protein n=1 Tax=Vibrio europaeus TaxID=300876 RepID=A0ABT5GS21_9VIBR|nr:agmatine deiminase family protein [Vibrio europaeus]MDC5705769.1 agmatine deiminase family protein [Vibrio europaeus]MDC5709179.1 agmatine deiminase family protein [Vibrio europaeus]MDC5713578.1 agmatine deiminase family protein [Vibrio europaeus]MDC5720298.1 agmatine deiminase family protein [Vibrio europaeus]MDC5723815.1 agmatine deiminase family protein [Vibrio europaeus]